jgi:hypothetical protein
MHKLMNVIDFCYSLVLEILSNFIIIELLLYLLCIIFDVCRLGSAFMYFDMFYIQWPKRIYGIKYIWIWMNAERRRWLIIDYLRLLYVQVVLNIRLHISSYNIQQPNRILEKAGKINSTICYNEWWAFPLICQQESHGSLLLMQLTPIWVGIFATWAQHSWL